MKLLLWYNDGKVTHACQSFPKTHGNEICVTRNHLLLYILSLVCFSILESASEQHHHSSTAIHHLILLLTLGISMTATPLTSELYNAQWVRFTKNSAIRQVSWWRMWQKWCWVEQFNVHVRFLVMFGRSKFTQMWCWNVFEVRSILLYLIGQIKVISLNKTIITWSNPGKPSLHLHTEIQQSSELEIGIKLHFLVSFSLLWHITAVSSKLSVYYYSSRTILKWNENTSAI